MSNKKIIVKKKFSYSLELFEDCKFFNKEKLIETLKPYTVTKKETKKNIVINVNLNLQDLAQHITAYMF